MNVFVLCTGRCGSKTFSKACQPIKNYTASHESRSQFIEAKRLDYPDNHIEVDNRLSWVLGRLDRKYGDGAIYVHLKRNHEAVARSYVKRYRQGIMKAYRGKGIILDLDKKAEPVRVALDYCDTVDSNIDLFLRDKTRKMVFNLETGKKDFPVFCKLIDAKVSLNEALQHFDIKYNG